MRPQRILDDSEQQEVEARTAVIRAAKLDRLRSGQAETMSSDELDAVLPAVPSALYRAHVERRERLKKLRAAGPTPAKCPSCGARVNQFDGRCIQCEVAAPLVRPQTDPNPKGTPDDCHLP